ncbi:Clp protease ClpP [Brachyspira intermedia]|uniref:head maturation protease, ClpP-related n=1 Tax=Brachyspira TaxID=29521 RepID=UPI00262D3E3A|nr:head maturation protease, ClpP-related [Brachyspira innocens]
MNKISISGIIGWDFTSRDFRNLTQNMNGDLEIEITSPGGFVFSGIEIHNLIKEYSNNKGKVTIKIIGLCASIASYIAMAGDKIISYDNAVFMIHNVSISTSGDYRELNKQAKEIEALTNIIAKAYSKKLNIDINEIRKLMDNETFYYGEEILGFSDEVVSNGNGEVSNKEEAYILAKNRIYSCINKMSESNKAKDDLKKAVAFLALAVNTDDENNDLNNSSNNITKTAEFINTSENNNAKKEDKKIMDLQELKEQQPELYKTVFNLGIEHERKRVMAHIKLGKASNLIDKSISYIENGASISDDEVLAEYHSAQLSKNILNMHIEENPENTNMLSEEDKDKALEEQYLNELNKYNPKK